MREPTLRRSATRRRERLSHGSRGAVVLFEAGADFFRKTEPHSPVAYLADKAAAWGDLPLHAWLRTVAKDQGSLAHIEELLGLHASPGEN